MPFTQYVLVHYLHVSLTDSSLSIYDGAALSDVKLQLDDGKEILAHKAILGEKSVFFRKAFEGQFLVRTSLSLFHVMSSHVLGIPWSRSSSSG